MVNTYNTIIGHEIDSDLPDWQQTFKSWQFTAVVKPRANTTFAVAGLYHIHKFIRYGCRNKRIKVRIRQRHVF
jgi:hypothetical protein